MKAADIDTTEFLDAIERIGDTKSGAKWCQLYELCEVFPAFPYKVILAKARILEKKGYIGGCTCGCRGDLSVYRDYGCSPDKFPRPNTGSAKVLHP